MKIKVILSLILVAVTVMSVIYFQGIERQPEYRDEYHEGIIIAKNDTRLVFYVEEQTGSSNFRVWTLDVDPIMFFQFDIGDHWAWVIRVKIHQGGMVNVTMEV